MTADRKPASRSPSATAKRLGAVAALATALVGSHAFAQGQAQAKPATSAAVAAASTSSSAPATELPGCPGMVIDHATDETLNFYNELLDPVATATGRKAPHSLHIPIADCDSNYDYVELAPLVDAHVVERTHIYVGGRAAVKVADVVSVSLASLVPPPPPVKSPLAKKTPAAKKPK